METVTPPRALCARRTGPAPSWPHQTHADVCKAFTQPSHERISEPVSSVFGITRLPVTEISHLKPPRSAGWCRGGVRALQKSLHVPPRPQQHHQHATRLGFPQPSPMLKLKNSFSLHQVAFQDSRVPQEFSHWVVDAFDGLRGTTAWWLPTNEAAGCRGRGRGNVSSRKKAFF